MPIPSILTHRLRETLAQHPALADDRTLRAVFVDERLAPWRDLAPESTPSCAARVAALINTLCDQENTQGEKALVLFLRALAEQTPSGDALHNTLISLAARLEAHPPTPLAALKIPAPVGSITITSDGNVVGNGNTVTVNKPTTVGGNIHFHEPPPPERPAHPLWERFRNHPLIFYPTVIFGVVAAIVGLIGVLISAGADFGGATDQFREWGLVRDFRKERKGEILIVIASFYHTEGIADTAAHNEIKRAIETEAHAHNFNNLRVEVEPTRLQADDRAGAQALGDRYNASLVIWGADTGVRISVNFYNRKQPDFDAADIRIEETTRTQIAAPSEYAEFITQDLPDKLTFLSLFAVGQSYYVSEDYTASAQAIEAAVARLGDSPTIEGAAEAYSRLGWLYLIPSSDATNALANYTRVIELDPQDARAYNNRGGSYTYMGDYNRAIADYNRAIELDPQDARTYSNRGANYAYMDDYTLAIADLDRAIELNPQYATAYSNRGNIYIDLNEYGKALGDLNRAIELDPQDAFAYNGRGMYYVYVGDYPTTKRLLTLADKMQDAGGKMQEAGEQIALGLTPDSPQSPPPDSDPVYRLPPTVYLGFEVHTVNHYDIFRNPLEARDLLLQALEVQPLAPGHLFDGEKDGRLVKLMPINRIATRADLNELIHGFDYTAFEQRRSTDPTKPVERLTLVCMGHEPDLKAILETETQPYKLDVEVVDILRDRDDLIFKRDAEADIAVEGGALVIRTFYPLNLLHKLSLQKETVADWRELVESVLIDWNYDGAALQPATLDIPGKNELVAGRYSIPADAGTIRIKITDLLSESLEVEVPYA